MYRYHYEVGFPTNLRRPAGKFTLTYSNHARRAAHDDRYGPIDWLPRTLRLPNPGERSPIRLIECDALADGTLVKGVYRMPYDETYSLVVVLLFDQPEPLVKTVWLNLRTDVHRTLDTSKYDRPCR